MGWLRALLFRRRLDEDMDEEIRVHVEMQAEHNRDAGMSPEEARLAALRQFGGVEAVKQRCREQRRTAWLDGLVQDVRHGARTLRKQRTFTVMAVLTLALGIGVNTAMFSVVDALLFAPAPYPRADQLVRLYRTSAQSASLPHSLPDFIDEREQGAPFSALAAFCWWTYSLAEPGEPAQRVAGVMASAELWSVLGVQPAVGRLFTAEEQQPGRDRVAVLSHRWWQRRLGGDPAVIGQRLRIDGEEVTVVGVLPASAGYPLFWGEVDLWRPLPLASDWRQNRATRWLNVVGRLEAGVAPAQAQATMAVVAARLSQQYPATSAGAGLRVVPLHRTVMDDVARELMWFTVGLALFVLLIACANIANLQLARGIASLRDFAVHAALGASRGRLIRKSLVETTLLALGGGACGVVLARLLAAPLGAHILGARGEAIGFALDPRLLAFALGASLAAGLLAGAAPAWFSSRPTTQALLRGQPRGATAGRRRQRLRHALIVAQVASCLLLLGGSGFFIRGLRQALGRDLGWDTRGLLIGQITLPAGRYPGGQERRIFHQRLLAGLAALPGVEQAALASEVPIRELKGTHPLVVEGHSVPPAGREARAYLFMASAGLFETLHIRLLQGETFSPALRPDAPPVVVINETMARQLWPGQSAIGKRIRTTEPDAPWRQVIGVVRDVTFAGHFGALETRMQVYCPLVEDPWGYFTVVLRGPGALEQLLPRVVATLDRELPVANLRTVDAAVAHAQENLRAVNQLLAGFAILGLALAAVGLYGVVAGLVAQRRQEFAIRMALGSQRRDVLWLVLRTGGWLAALGTLCGAAATALLFRLLATIVPGLPARALPVLTPAVLLLLAVTLFACLLPAHRAARVDPMTALRDA
jgi:putative ABC transport system permease protein